MLRRQYGWKVVLQAEWQSLQGKEKGASWSVPYVIWHILVKPTVAMVKVVTLHRWTSYTITNAT